MLEVIPSFCGIIWQMPEVIISDPIKYVPIFLFLIALRNVKYGYVKAMLKGCDRS